MRIVVHGAGAIGGWLAARLAAAGEEVALIARGPHLEAIRAQGLGVTEDGVRRVFRLPASDDPAEIGAADLVIYGVKAHQLDAALAASGPLRREGMLALTTQNGVDAPERVAAAFGADRTCIGVARVSAEIVAPGEIGEVVVVRGLSVGGMDGAAEGPAATPVRAALARAGVPMPETPDVRGDMWRKMILWNAASAAVAARLPASRARAAPEYRALAARLAREATAVAIACGAPVTEADGERVVAEVTRPADPDAPFSRPSMLADLEAGKPLELDHLVGWIARRGAALGVPVPASEAVTAVIAPWREGRAA